MKGSQTVTSLIIEVGRVAKNQEQLRALMVEILTEMLKISQVQAEANLRFLKLVEDQTQAMRIFTAAGPGTTRSYSEAAEAQAWREEVDRATERDVEEGL
jgi:hypothetical protein